MAVEWGKKGLLSEKTRWFNEIWEKDTSGQRERCEENIMRLRAQDENSMQDERKRN